MTPLCSVCHGTGTDPKSRLPILERPVCPHCSGSGDEPELYDEERLDEDDELWEQTLTKRDGPVKNEANDSPLFDEDSEFDDENDDGDWD